MFFQFFLRNPLNAIPIYRNNRMTMMSETLKYELHHRINPDGRLCQIEKNSVEMFLRNSIQEDEPDRPPPAQLPALLTLSPLSHFSLFSPTSAKSLILPICSAAPSVWSSAPAVHSHGGLLSIDGRNSSSIIDWKIICLDCITASKNETLMLRPHQKRCE